MLYALTDHPRSTPAHPSSSAFPASPTLYCATSKGDCRWREIANLGNSGPGRRWKASTVMVNNVFYLFGGHRQWHGFGGTNSVENKWTDTFQYALGGYLDDLWEYRKGSKHTAVVQLSSTSRGARL